MPGTTATAKLAHSVGKPGKQMQAGGYRGASAPITGGSSMAQGMNHYGKAGPSGYAAMALPGSTGVDPTAHAGKTTIRGEKGGIRSNAREGGLGPGAQSAAGNDSNYSMTNNGDTE